MAEGFARAHGSGVIEPQSAGLAPARTIASLTHKVMLEKNIDMQYISSKGLDEIMGGIDLIVNMSGEDLPFKTRAPVERWDIRDPIGQSKQVYREVRDEIEQRGVDRADCSRQCALQLIEGGAHLQGRDRIDGRRRIRWG